MAWLRRIWNVLQPGRLQDDLQREVQFHLSERVYELRASGMSEPQAEITAHRQFGNVAGQVERTRDADVNLRLESAMRNLRHAMRSLSRTPAFTLTVVLTLAIGMGANSAVFSAIYAVLLRPLPYPNSDQLVRITQRHPTVAQPLVAPQRLEDWNRMNSTLQGIAGSFTEDTSESSGEMPERLRRAFVTPRFFDVLGVYPVVGRPFLPAEERFGGPSVVIISDRLWRRRFASDPGVIHKTVQIGRASIPIAGVMPPTFPVPDSEVDLWSPSPPDAPYAQERRSTWYTGIGRLKPGVTLAQAQANLATVQANLGKQYPKSDAELTVRVEPLKETAVGGVRGSLLVLFASVTVLLLIACTNIAALLLSRATNRRHELAVRFSLGASRRAVAVQLLTEVFVLAVAGGMLGLLIAYGTSGVFRLLAKDLPRVDEIGLRWPVVAYSVASALGVTLLCGLVPVLHGTRQPLAGSLAQGGRTSVAGGNRLQLTLVGVQVAFSVTLLAGAGLLLRSLQELSRVSPGFEPKQVLVFQVSTSWSETSDAALSKQRTERMLEAIRRIPGISAAATAVALPGVPTKYPAELEASQGRAETEPRLVAETRWVSPEYFAVARIPLLAGEMCREEAGARTMMVNRAFANAYFPGQSVVGQTLIRTGTMGRQGAVVRGVVGDARESGLDLDPPPTAYWCEEFNQPGTYFLVRSAADPDATAATIRRTLREIEPRRSVYGAAPLESLISGAYAEGRLRTVLLSLFALMATGLASVGLYGTLSYLVTVRRREVAVRLALGALRARIARQFLGEGLRVAMLGCVAGLILVVLSNRLLDRMLYSVTAADPAALAGVVVIVLLVAVAASVVPATRAARLEPLQALREE